MTGTAKEEPIMDAKEEKIDFDSFLPYYFYLISEGLGQRFSTVLKPYGVTIRRWRVLMVLMSEGPSNMTELRKKSLIEQSALTRVVDQMERDTLVTRRPNPDDNRVTDVFLTDQGRKMYYDLRPAAESYADGIVAGMHKPERRALVKSLKKILQNLDAG
ncbi:MarR family transcriptional regulator [Pseudotabrizicola sp. 4114]|uniref:MarR family winged helix-turn-helix transcriptional regulator n=1 Tax=Pseudotabrizicola sp. 4114 TaxID=2817731 RepID=UPI00285923B7|nr:DNA-binding MarR family transcriptional regulator [Pseudorhodobacter sp. 4114]